MAAFWHCRYWGLVLLMGCVSVSAQNFVLVNPEGKPVLQDPSPLNFPGCSWADYDNDGDPDLYLNDSYLYRNDGNEVFTPIDIGARLTQDVALGRGNSWADYDNDGDLDLFVSGSASYVYRNDGNDQFTRISEGAMGLGSENSGWTGAWSDFDNDGDVDMFITHPRNFLNGVVSSNHFLRNEGPPSYLFSKITDFEGVNIIASFTVPSFSDFDGDGDADLFIGSGPISNRGAADFLYRNMLAETGVASYERILDAPLIENADGQLWNWIDYDNDGDLDGHRTNWGEQGNDSLRRNDLYRNDISGFTAITQGDLVNDAAVDLGSVWGDFDNDGDLDCYVGHAKNNGANRYYRNNGDGSFTSITDTPLVTSSLSSRSMAAADYDNDGDLDLFIYSNQGRQLFRNELEGNHHWLHISCKGVTSNGAAIGLVVRAQTEINGETVRQMREINSQNSFGGHSDYRVHFGLGDAEVINELTLHWPSGVVQTFRDVASNQILSISEDQQTLASGSQLLFPWVSSNENFESIVVVNNHGSAPASARLTARRENGDMEESPLIVIPPGGFLEEAASALFPQLGAGSGYTVTLVSESEGLSGRWVTNNLTAATGKSPSQGVAVDTLKQEGDNQRLGRDLLFGYLPLTNGFVSAPVVVNTGTQATDVTLSFYNNQGTLVYQDVDSLVGLPPDLPFARVANTLLPNSDEDVVMVASSADQPLSGVVFVFNQQGETAIGNASGFDPGSPLGSVDLLYAWVSNNEGFESLLVANNLDDQPVTVELTALRAEGEPEVSERVIPAHGFLSEFASDLFPLLGSGSGYSVRLRADNGRIRGRWVTNNLLAASGRSPSQGVAVDLPGSSTAGNPRLGEYLDFGYLPVTDGLISAPVVVNTESGPVDVSLYFYNQNGSLLHVDNTSLAGLAPLRPFATLANSLVPCNGENVAMVAASPGNNLTGVSFVFNEGSEPAIGNVSAIGFQPQTRAEPVAMVTVANTDLVNPATAYQVSFPPASDELRITNYRLFVVPASQSFDLVMAEALGDERFQDAAKTGQMVSVDVALDQLDIEGAELVENMAYNIYVMSVADGSNATLNALSCPSEALFPYVSSSSVEAVAKPEVADVNNRKNGRDLEVSFNPVAQDSDLIGYDIYVVPTALVNDFDVAAALEVPADHATSIPLSGEPIRLRLAAEATDVLGQPITEDVAYRVFVLSRADRVGNHALSQPSDEISLAFNASLSVTYLGNDGIMIDDGQKKVFVDVLQRRTDWLSLPQGELTAIENAVTPYDNVDLVMATHSHDDHFNPASLRAFFGNNLQALFMGPPQATRSVSDLSDRTVDVTPSRGERQVVTVNGITVEVLHLRHFDAFGNDFSGVENYGFLIHMGGKKLLHVGDVDASTANFEPFGLWEEEIDVVFLPTFISTVHLTEQARDAVITQINPGHVVGLHLTQSAVATVPAAMAELYPGSTVFTVPLEVVEF